MKSLFIAIILAIVATTCLQAQIRTVFDLNPPSTAIRLSPPESTLYGASVVRHSEQILSSERRPRFTFSRISLALAVQMNALGLSLWAVM
jgi:hypothetical protein